MDSRDVSALEKIKFIPQTMKQKVELPEEIKLARYSPAYWWFRCLEASDEYRTCCRNKEKGELAETYKLFGNIFEYRNFDAWWVKHGRFLFIQQQPLKKVKEVDLERLKIFRPASDQLLLDIPLTLRKQTAMRQIGAFLKKAYEGRNIDIQQTSTAKIKFVKSKIQMSTVERLLKLYRLRERHPRLSLNELGIKAGIELDLFARMTSADDVEANSDADTEARRMTIAVSRYLKQARHLIDNAEHGIFPSIKPRK